MGKELSAIKAVLFLAALMCAPAAQGADDAALLPPAATAGYSKAGQPRFFKGAQLYDHIDGGGEPFLELGFEACTVQKYSRGKSELVCEIYRMSDAAAALGVYLMNCGAETPSPQIQERHALSPNQLILLKGAFYAVVTSPEESPGLDKDLVAFGKALASLLPGAPAPGVLGLLPREGQVPGSLRIIRGPVLLDSVVTLGPGDILQLKGKVTALSADYAGQGGAVETRIAAQYPDEQEARSALAHLKAHLDGTFEVVSEDSRGFTVHDRRGAYGRACVEGERLEVRLGLAQKPGCASASQGAGAFFLSAAILSFVRAASSGSVSYQRDLS